MLFLLWTHCIVKKTLAKINQSQNYYLVKVKRNQPRLANSIIQTINQYQAVSTYSEQTQLRGRLESRQTFLFERVDNMDPGWESITRIVLVQRKFVCKDKTHQTDSFYVTNLMTNDAKLIAQGVRSHWGIENKLHWVKDVIMREDTESTKNKKAAPNLAILRNFAFNILKANQKSIKYASEIFANLTIKQILNIISRI